MPELRVEPFRSLARAGRFTEAARLDAPDVEARFARAQVRAMAGREDDARADLEACLPELGDRALIELALLDIRQRSALPAARDHAARIAEFAGRGSPLAARAQHVLGLAEGKLRRTGASLEALLGALGLYRELGERQGAAEVHDTLGSVFAAQGRLEAAVNHYALSLVDKSRTGDRYGMAMTLGNLGRLHLRAGRARDAIDCFRMDLELAEELSDARGVARMREDLGRAWHALEDFSRAKQELLRALELARAQGFRDLEFFALKDLALVEMQSGDLALAGARLARAKELLGDGEPYFHALLAAARGELLYHEGDPKALEVLARAARDFETADLPDLEIPLLIALAGAYAEQGLKENAEACLRRAAKRARSDGYARYLPKVREAMAQLDVVDSAVEERGRLALPVDRERAESDAGPTDGYVRVQALGKGAFGEVFRAYDPARGHDVAIKRLSLEGVYDNDRRRRLLVSARLELEAASRLRHPGLARVFAFGTDAGGATYIVQEFVDGEPLRARIPRGPTASASEVAAGVGKIAHALAALHADRVVHRDLKPENVLLRRASSEPVLIDFGIAHVPDERHQLSEGFIVGTLEYMPPEQADGKRVDGAADVYALGVLTYEWLTGVRPIRLPRTSLAELADELEKRKPTPIGEWRPGLPIRLVELIDRMLAKKAAKRPSAEEVAEECEEIVRSLRTATTRP